MPSIYLFITKNHCNALSGNNAKCLSAGCDSFKSSSNDHGILCMLVFYLLTFLNLNKKKTQNLIESTEPEGTHNLFCKQKISISSHQAPMRYSFFTEVSVTEESSSLDQNQICYSQSSAGWWFLLVISDFDGKDPVAEGLSEAGLKSQSAFVALWNNDRTRVACSCQKYGKKYSTLQYRD